MSGSNKERSMRRSCITAVSAGAVLLLASYPAHPTAQSLQAASLADVLPGRAADPAEKLPELPSSRTDRAVFALDLRERAPMGEKHENQGGIAADAALVRRSERTANSRTIRRCPRAKLTPSRNGPTAARPRVIPPTRLPHSVGRERLDRQAGLHHQGHGLSGSGPHAEDVIEWATYIVPSGFTKDTWITSLEIKPSELSVTHHICISFIEHDPASSTTFPSGSIGSGTKRAWTLPATASTTSCPPGSADRNVTASGNDGCYVPGKSFEDYRVFNAAKLIPAGSDVRVQIHYTPSGKESVDRPKSASRLPRQPPQRIYVTSGMSAPGDRKVFAIPPNHPNWLSPPAEATFDAMRSSCG